MNAVLDVDAVTRAAAAEAVDAEKFDLRFPTLQSAWAGIANLLHQAAMTDEPENYSGDSTRLLFAANAAAAKVSTGLQPSDDEIESIAFDVEALIIASLRVERDTPTPERLGLLTLAVNMVTSTCGHGDQAMAAIEQASSPKKDSVRVLGTRPYSRQIYEEPQRGPHRLTEMAGEVLAAIPVSDAGVNALKKLVRSTVEELAVVNNEAELPPATLMLSVLEDASVDLHECICIIQLLVNGCPPELELLYTAELLLQHAKLEADSLAADYMQKVHAA